MRDWRKDMERVTSYRVRDFDPNNYIVESYTVQLEDERLSYTESKSDGHVWYNSYLRSKEYFREYILKKCMENGYDYGAYTEAEDTEARNFFLATHYFPQGSRADLAESIAELNRISLQYMGEHNSSLDNPADVDIEEQLSKAKSLLGDGIDYIECLNVGQANFSIGYNRAEDSPLACFDIGILSSKQAGINRKYAIDKISTLDEKGIVVISHYDYDHINGRRYISQAAFDRIWILPQKRLSPTPSERRLLNQLKPGNCIFRNDIDYGITPFDPAQHILTIGNIEIYQGNANKVDPNQSTLENARCLICLVKKKKSILFPADCLYAEFPCPFKVDYLVIPHHCCFYDGTIKNIDISQLKRLIIFAGPNNRYKHPDITHLDKLTPTDYKNVRCLMNHNAHYFQSKTKKLPPPQLCLERPSYIINL